MVITHSRGWEIASLFNLGVATFVHVITIGHRVINGDPSFFISETVLEKFILNIWTDKAKKVGLTLPLVPNKEQLA